MEVELRLYNYFQKNYQSFNKKNEVFMQLTEGTTAGDLIEILNIPRHEIGLIIVNHEIATADTKLKDKDRISLSPPVSGG